ncbi:hypothetical protein MHU86_21424 [Fragilaria crotonensis]|nr:hypothetical protein MHU86_21424 [Fragilaria crotonensis]
MRSAFEIPWGDGMERISPRFLDTQGTNSTNDDEVQENVTHILQDSMRIYGSIFICGFVVYCYVRKRIPRTFAVRQWIPEHKTPLAQDQFGYISWIWKVYSFSERVAQTIGLDALCF